ncbi:MAG: sigma-70 family RNA polymerase sigma factor [Candidatus Acidiferrales bacterium]|jgi:RNA polymerase sigma-70 factor (ECF subfamily)
MVTNQIGAIERVPFGSGDAERGGPAEETALIERARRKDGAAFASLIQPHMCKAYWAALRITGNREDAEDVTQQSLLKAYTHMDQFHEKARFSTWLLRITINEALGKLRQRRSESLHRSCRFVNEGSSESEMLEAGDEARPEVLYVKTERGRLLREAIGGLRGNSRAVVWLLGLEERQMKETARILNLSEAAVKARFMRARQKLRSCLEGRV